MLKQIAIAKGKTFKDYSEGLRGQRIPAFRPSPYDSRGELSVDLQNLCAAEPGVASVAARGLVERGVPSVSGLQDLVASILQQRGTIAPEEFENQLKRVVDILGEIGGMAASMSVMRLTLESNDRVAEYAFRALQNFNTASLEGSPK
jgi:hypothetical protein